MREISANDPKQPRALSITLCSHRYFALWRFDPPIAILLTIYASWLFSLFSMKPIARTSVGQNLPDIAFRRENDHQAGIRKYLEIILHMTFLRKWRGEKNTRSTVFCGLPRRQTPRSSAWRRMPTLFRVDRSSRTADFSPLVTDSGEHEFGWSFIERREYVVKGTIDVLPSYSQIGSIRNLVNVTRILTHFRQRSSLQHVVPV
ncbi:hypothetical protein GMOD_00003992 [Pyrenophora seminiperda CCB06]|uniref:Uncharacterized protein n=1 Tax=Pyrenophora seminiperda CCB06 TaxID=1302712 RepID=A0A3M7M071_9PLEO|nr:hypothetical protein GMOD_00003992 [Pyrenophora seminiperda CCB06]